jgi:formylglycine-generating enzyme required for sulfatase activity
MALVSGVCVDRWEAHLVKRDAPAEKLSPYERPSVPYAARSEPGVFPQAYLNRKEATLACVNAGKRLCRASEWRAACTHGGRTRFPYGSELVSGRCNSGKPHLPPKLFGAETHLTFENHYNSPKLNREPGYLAKTGEYAECRTSDGLYDLVGNLHEWVSDSVSARFFKEFPLEYGIEKAGSRGNGVFLGGYFSSRAEHGTGCAYATTHHDAAYHDYSIGFRCCRDPELGTGVQR